MRSTSLPRLALAVFSSLAASATPTAQEEPGEEWPEPAFLDLHLDLSAPPHLTARARVTFDGVTARHVRFLLNEALAVTSATTPDGASLACKKTFHVGRRTYHGEGRTWRVDLGRDPDPAGERVTLDLAISGQGADRSARSDWRGMLLLAPDEMRMSEQTIFYPQVPLTFDGPGIARTPARVEVVVPEGLEVFVAGAPVEPRTTPPAGARAWAFDVEQPGTLAVVAGAYERSEREVDGLRLVSLLSAEHADRSDAWLTEAANAVRFFSRLYGPHGSPALGVVEMHCLKRSYNWAARGLLMFDTAVFRGGEVVTSTLAHEVAHLWWGQAVRAEGEGERFLTEGLAEYSAWRYLEETRGADAAAAAAREGRDSYLRTVHRTGEDPALARVHFGTPGYSDLAYRKGALVLRHAEHALGREAFDAGLARYVERHRDAPVGLEGFLAAVAGGVAEGRELLPWIHADGHAHVELATSEGAAAAEWTLGECPAGIPSCAPGAIAWEAVPGGATGTARFDAGRLRVPLPEGEVAAVLLDPRVTAPLAGAVVLSLRSASLVKSDPEEGAEAVPYLRRSITLELDRPLARLDRDAARALRARAHEAASEAGARAPWLDEPVLSADGRTIELGLKGPLEPDASYLVHLEGLVDRDGAPVSPVQLRFRTAPRAETERPRVVSTEPASGATDVPADLSEIRIRFSEPMRPGRGYPSDLIRTLEERGLRFPTGILGSSRWEEGGTVLVYDLDAPLEPGVTYVMPLRGSFLDLAANVLEDFDLTFAAGER